MSQTQSFGGKPMPKKRKVIIAPKRSRDEGEDEPEPSNERTSSSVKRTRSALCTRLVIVCCHATYLRPENRDDIDPQNENQWLLAPFQKSNHQLGKPGEHHTFIQHAAAGMQALHSDLRSFLVLSGGCTRSETDVTEAKGYYNVMCAEEGREELAKVAERLAIEERATDSFQNLLFSIVLFRQHVGRYPESVTVITHGFKASRFFECHAGAIKWPGDRIRVNGISPPFTQQELIEVEKSETKNGMEPFTKDPYGVQDFLGMKRRQRGWDDSELHALGEGLEDNVVDLLNWKGGESGKEIFPNGLPWQAV